MEEEREGMEGIYPKSGGMRMGVSIWRFTDLILSEKKEEKNWEIWAECSFFEESNM